MNDKKKFLIIILAFILLIAGSLALYNKLIKDAAPRQMVVLDLPEATEIPAATEAPSETEDPASGVSHEHHNHADDEEVFHAPDVRIYDREGNEVQLSQYFGKPTVLNFWASWCGPCQSEMPDFNQKYKELGDQVNFVMVNMTDGQRETVESASRFIDMNGFEFPVFYDTAGKAAYIYEAYSLPTTYFIDAGGHIIAQAVGAIDAETLQEGINLFH